MAFCTNCGKPLASGVNFCPGCGTRVTATPAEAKTRGYKEKMFKGMEQRLKTSLQGQARSAAENIFSKAAGEARHQAGTAFNRSMNSNTSGSFSSGTAKSPYSDTGQEIRETFGGKSGDTGRAHPGNSSGKISGQSPSGTPKEALPETKGKGISAWIWIFLLLSILLGVAGFIAYGKIEAWAYGIGRVLALSAVILAGVMFRRKKAKPLNWLVRILLLGQMLLLVWILYNRVMGQYFDFSALVMAALFITDFKLLFSGNKN